MSHRFALASAVVALASCLTASSLPASGDDLAGAQESQQAGAQIEVCFVLDTTGSMSGLIEGAKAKIWSIANQMIAAKPTPRLKIALVGYRDRGDEYVTKVYDLSDDIDAVYARLREFQAAGGGDTPESVNQALHEAVHRIGWSSSRDVLKIIFLVGDCPPHMDYSGDIKYTETCQAAVKKDLIINTIQCGSHAETTLIWQDIARLAEGKYVAIGQTGDMQVLATPMDAELAELNVAIGKTLIPFGGSELREGVARKQLAAECATPATVADRLAYNAAVGRTVQGAGELVDALRAGMVKLEEVPEKDLPPELQRLTLRERAAFVQQKAEERQKLQQRVDELLRQRQTYIDTQLRKLSATGQGNGFDAQVAQLLREQAGKKGIRYLQPDAGETVKP